MLIVLAILLAGILVGYFSKWRLRRIDRLIIVIIWTLLFVLGIEVGSNEAIVSRIRTIGVDALIVTTGAVVGSTAFAWALWMFIRPRTPRQDAYKQEG
ncbi:MAG: lysine exporter LysO family protein [Prevotellaceae bacterium]|jgi:uncharacterized membrane protein YbjE (DUF340 family)|nr:lysine exporter LysO family protein [Prevotellaceae bacterium]